MIHNTQQGTQLHDSHHAEQTCTSVTRFTCNFGLTIIVILVAKAIILRFDWRTSSKYGINITFEQKSKIWCKNIHEFLRIAIFVLGRYYFIRTL